MPAPGPVEFGAHNGRALRGLFRCGSRSDRDFLCRQTERYQSTLEVAIDTVGSSDIFKDPRSSILDLAMIRVVDGDLAIEINWYDNEWSCADQMVREVLRVEG